MLCCINLINSFYPFFNWLYNSVLDPSKVPLLVSWYCLYLFFFFSLVWMIVSWGCKGRKEAEHQATPGGRYKSKTDKAATNRNIKKYGQQKWECDHLSQNCNLLQNATQHTTSLPPTPTSPTKGKFIQCTFYKNHPVYFGGASYSIIKDKNHHQRVLKSKFN